MRFHRGAQFLVGLVVVVAFGLFAGSALADGPATFVRQFGGTGSSSGDLNTAAGLAVDPTSGDLLVADDDNERIDEFSSSGSFLKAWGAGVADGLSTSYQTCNATTTPCHQGVASASPGGMNRPKAVAVDASGNVFVADSSNNRVDEFDSSGAFVEAWGWGVIPGQTAAFQTCTQASGCQAGSTNGGEGAGNLVSPYGVAVGPSGDVFVAEYTTSRISVFDPSGATVKFVRAWGWGVADQQQQFEICTSGCHAGSSGTGAGGQGGAFDGATGITVDPSSGDVYVNDSLNYRVQQFHNTGAFVRTWGWGVADGQPKLETCTTTASDATGCQPGIAGHGDAGQFDNGIAQPVGIAIDATGNIDAVDQFNNRVQQFARDGTFQSLFGYGVTDGQNTFENCQSSCQQGLSGTNPGELFLPTGIAADTTGDVYVDNGNVIEQYSVPMAALTAPSGVAAATAGATEIDLNWNAVSGATGYKVLRSTTTGGPYTQIGTPTGATFNNTGLTPGTTYYYVVQATNAGATSPNSTEASATTTPSAPTGLTAAPAGANEIDLNWSAASGATGYQVLRATTSGGPYTQVAAPSGTSYHDTGVNPATTYYYVVQATNGTTSANSNEASATTPSGAPTALTAATAGPTEIDLNWAASAGATGYQVLRTLTTGGPYTAVGTPTTTTYNDTGLNPGTTYYYVVQATTGNTSSAHSNEASATTAPGAPTGLTANANGPSEIDLNWTGVSGASGYQILRSTTSGGPYTQIATPTTTTYNDSGVSAGTTYYYVVKATGAGGPSAQSNEASAATSLAQRNLTVIKSGGGSGTVTSDTGGINCGSACSGSFADGAQVSLTANPNPGSTFAGWSGGGCSGTGPCSVTIGTANQTVTAVFTTTLGATTGTVRSVSASGAQVFGLVNPDGTDANTWFEYGTDTNYGSQTTPDDAGTQNGYVAEADLNGLKPGTTYHYRIVAQLGSGSEAFGADRTFTTLGPRVSGISVTGIGQHGATISVNVDPAGHDTTVHLDYGTDTSYGNPSPSDVSLPAGGGAKTAQISLTTLQPATTYHFRLVVDSSDATITSGDNTFTTTACPQCAKPSIGGIQAQSAPAPGQDFAGSGTVSAMIDPHGDDTDVHVDYGPTSSYGASASGPTVSGAGDAQSVEIDLSNLTANATYHFRVVAHNINGTTNSSDQTFTACPSCAAPTISNVQVVQTSPDTVPATANTNVLHDGSAVLSAVVDPHGLSTQVKVLQGTKNLRTGQVTTGPFLHGRVGAQTVSGGPTIVQFSPQNLDGGDYTFQIIATNGDGADQTADPAATGAFSLHIPAAITNSYPGCTLGPGSTPKAPTFDQTPTVASVNDQSATLSATIDPQRCNTLVSVSYRPVNTTASHALTTTAQQIGGCTRGQGACVPTPPTALQLPVPGQIGGGVAGLQPDTTYEANVIAASSAGTTTSSTITFTTSSALLPQTATATATTASSTMTCATKQTCSGTAVIAVPAGGFALDGGAARAATSGRLIVLGSVRFRIRGHHHAVIKVPLNAKGRRAVRGHRTLKAVLVITFRPPGKTPYTVRHPIKVVRRR